MKYLIAGTLLLTASLLQAQEVTIIPQPRSLKQTETIARFSITPATLIVLEGSNMNNSVSFFNDYLQRFYLFKLKVVNNSTSPNAIRLNYERLDNDMSGAYNMTVDAKGVYIAGDNEDGVFYGIQSLIQLLPVPDSRLKMRPAKLEIPYLSIEDAPRFAYRGLHLDVGRHYMPLDFIKRYIDYIALHKMNYFHWHLTDDQGWRIEIKKYPKLTSVGGWRNGTIIGRYPGTGNDGIKYGGFYTQAQVKEIVAYAQKRYITVVPEIEMPGHASAAIAAYPELSCFPGKQTEYPKQCAWSGPTAGKQVQQTWGVFDDVFCAGKENTFKFLEDVMDEVLPLFPSTLIHVGGDECPKAHWKICSACQQRMKDNNLKDEHELQSYFIQRMEKYLNKKGRKLIGWDEILEGGLAPNAAVMSWRGEQGGIDAAKQNHDVVMTPGNPVYFDHSQSEHEDSVTIGGYNPIEKVYAWDPVPKELNEEQAKHILGAQANLWTEYIKNPAKAEYMLFPRVSALSEILWSPAAKKSWDDFESRLKTQFKRYDLWKTNYSKAYFDLKSSVLPTENNTGVLWKLESKNKDSRIQYSKTLTANDPPNPPAFYTYTSPVQITVSGDYHAWTTENGRRMPNTMTQRFSLNKTTGKKITLEKAPSKNYPGNGAFTLVDGIQNEKGMGRTKEFLGFSGDDCLATIDLSTEQSISFVKVHYLHQPSSWIWQPAAVVISVSQNGADYNTVALSNPTIANNQAICEFLEPVPARFIKIQVTHAGIIPTGNPGAGTKAWLFVDELEVN